MALEDMCDPRNFYVTWALLLRSSIEAFLIILPHDDATILFGEKAAF
jgi:hypothetical protein